MDKKTEWGLLKISLINYADTPENTEKVISDLCDDRVRLQNRIIQLENKLFHIREKYYAFIEELKSDTIIG